MKEYKYKINGTNYKVNVVSVEGNVAEVEVNGTTYTVEMENAVKKPMTTISRPAAVSPVAAGNPAATTTAPKTQVKPAAPAAGGPALKSPLPGVILEVFCKEGDQVKRGQKLFVLEAMKMENVINADKDGEIKQVLVSKGSQVLEGDNLVIIG